MPSSLSRYSSAPKTKRIFQMLWCIFEGRKQGTAIPALSEKSPKWHFLTHACFQKNFGPNYFFWSASKWWHRKGHFEINWPLQVHLFLAILPKKTITPTKSANPAISIISSTFQAYRSVWPGRSCDLYGNLQSQTDDHSMKDRPIIRRIKNVEETAIVKNVAWKDWYVDAYCTAWTKTDIFWLPPNILMK